MQYAHILMVDSSLSEILCTLPNSFDEGFPLKTSHDMQEMQHTFSSGKYIYICSIWYTLFHPIIYITLSPFSLIIISTACEIK